MVSFTRIAIISQRLE